MQRLSRLLVAVLLVAAIAIFFARPAFAYGKDNWQLGFSGTGVIPGTGQGFGFWGWCTAQPVVGLPATKALMSPLGMAVAARS
jgi:hypothetical protein